MKSLRYLAAAILLQIAAAAPPNVVFILADDLGYGELGCYGQKKIHTPNIDRLAAEGTRFTQHYSGAPVCAPARCVLMTGKHLGHADIRGNMQAFVRFPQFKEGQLPIAPTTVTMAEVFKKAGYDTAAIGKWGLGPAGSTGDPNKHGFDLFYGYNCQAVAHSYYPKFLWRNDQQILINEKPIPGGKQKPEGEVRAEDYIGQTYAPDLMVKEAQDFIVKRASQSEKKPFFLYLAFIEPHVSMHPPLDRLNEYPTDWDTQPYRGENGYLPHPRPRAAYAAMISDLDRHVGAVMKSLQANGFAENTLVVFTSDNGATHEGKPTSPFHIGGADTEFFNSEGDLRGFKGRVYEGGIRVPMIARFPGKIAAGKSSDVPGYFADWFPTLCAATGLTAPQGLDGENLWPVITGAGGMPTRKPMVWVYPEYGGQVAVRIGDFKVVRADLMKKKIGDWEVYDIAKDPGEKVDLAASRKDLVAEGIRVLKEQVAPNANFRLTIPDVTP